MDQIFNLLFLIRRKRSGFLRDAQRRKQRQQ
ncbi:hypothetical protein SEEN4881_22025 [Salmonella enterica subsp. enterica serovar Newport str. WA_14881]|nr:hypothetical protein SEEN4881_22025 [Salmonella enterica subsp. enterica serovar Newport str. WA_14881]KDU77416.1 hypothetical protein SEEH3312_18623 [Salmonella enterica subsp. enterica serovar Heidelberg str. RI-11-013312]